MSRVFASNSHTGAAFVKRSLHSTVDRPMLIDRLSSPSHPRYFKKISHSKHIKSSPNLFQSTGTYNKNRAAKRIKAVLDNRLKRFRMLDQDEFQEMLKSLSQQTANEQSTGMDTIGGMQLASKFSFLFLLFPIIYLFFYRLLVTKLKGNNMKIWYILSLLIALSIYIYIYILRFNKKECLLHDICTIRLICLFIFLCHILTDENE